MPWVRSLLRIKRTCCRSKALAVSSMGLLPCRASVALGLGTVCGYFSTWNFAWHADPFWSFASRFLFSYPPGVARTAIAPSYYSTPPPPRHPSHGDRSVHLVACPQLSLSLVLFLTWGPLVDTTPPPPCCRRSSHSCSNPLLPVASTERTRRRVARWTKGRRRVHRRCCARWTRSGCRRSCAAPAVCLPTPELVSTILIILFSFRVGRRRHAFRLPEEFSACTGSE